MEGNRENFIHYGSLQGKYSAFLEDNTALGLEGRVRPRGDIPAARSWAGDGTGEWEVGVETVRGRGRWAAWGCNPSPWSVISNLQPQFRKCLGGLMFYGNIEGAGFGVWLIQWPSGSMTRCTSQRPKGSRICSTCGEDFGTRTSQKVCLGLQRAGRPGGISTLDIHTVFSGI